MSNPHITWMFHGSTEASTLALAPGAFPESLRVTLPTGREVTFVKNGTVRDASHEVIGQEYRYVDGNPEGSDAVLTVFND